MCELFGLNSVDKINVTGLLKEFFSHGNEHPHGWGMAFFSESGVSVEKQPENSVKSRYLKHRLESCIVENKMMAHIRLATRGQLEYDNTHPFVMRDGSARTWIFEHNGTVFDCQKLNKYLKLQRGSTDSERIIMYITDRVNAAEAKAQRPLEKEERFALMDEIICEISPENKLNILFFDGELLYAHTNMRGTLHVLTLPETVIISTRPLDGRNWAELPLNTLVAFENGREAFRGTDHGNEFIETEEIMKLLFLDSACL